MRNYKILCSLFIRLRKNVRQLVVSSFGITLALVLSLLFCTVTKAAEMENVPYESYTYLYGLDNKKLVKDYPLYEVKERIDGHTLGISSITNPSSLCYDGKERIYLLDGENSRILVLNTNYRLIKVIERLNLDGQKLDFTGAQGIFADEIGTLIVSDTQNGRVLVCNQDGVVQSVLELPQSDLIPNDFHFLPVKAVRDKKGFTYVLNNGTYYGAMMYEKDGTFLGFYGANKVTVNPLSVIGDLFESLFNTVAKRATSEQKLPYQFADLCLDDNDFIYTVTADDESGTGQIKRLNPQGSNILYYKDGYDNNNANAFNFGDVLLNDQDVQNFTSIAVDKFGYIYALQNTYGKVFVYDSECRCLTVFGGNIGSGNQTGTFQSADSLCVVEDDILVLDSIKNTVTVFGITDYGALIKQANALTLSADYQEALPYWQKVLQFNSNCQLANSGIAKAYYAVEDYEQAAHYAKLGIDRNTYAAAFKELRTAYLKENFYWIFTIAIILLAGITTLLVYTTKRNVVLIRNQQLRLALSVFTHPFNTFNQIKYKAQGSVLISIGILILFYIVSVLDAIYSGFMYNVFDSANFNCLYTLMGGVGVAVLWVIVNWSVCTLFEGKGRIKEIFIVTAYSLLPLLLQKFLHLTLSQFLIPTESSLIPILSVACYIVFGLLLMIGTMKIQEYSFFKTLGTALLTILGMALVVFVLFMAFTLFQNFVGFIRSVVIEVLYR